MNVSCKWCRCCVCVSARRLEVYEAEKDEAGARSMTLRSGCSRKSLSCRSLSCNCSSVSLNALTAESEEEEQQSNHVQARTSAFCSRVVSLSHTSSHCRHFKCVFKCLKYLYCISLRLKSLCLVTVELQIDIWFMINRHTSLKLCKLEPEWNVTLYFYELIHEKQKTNCLWSST